MFDDQMPKTSGQVPGNLPMGEPEDMFSEVEKVEPAGVPAVDAPPDSPSALGAGALRPVEKEMIPAPEVAPGLAPEIRVSQPELNKVEESLGIQGSAPAQPAPQAPPTPPAASADMYAIKEPALTRGLVGVIIAVVAVLILGSGGWWIYNSFIRTTPDDSFILPPVTEQVFPEEDQLIIPEEVEELITVPEESEEVVPEEDLGQNILDEQILFGEPVDTDGDGLDDQRENEIGTDPNNWDSDGDELSDGDEVIIWKTEPLNPDTDGDSFLDGAEIKSGYNPAGPGKLFEPPTEENVEIIEEVSV